MNKKSPGGKRPTVSTPARPTAPARPQPATSPAAAKAAAAYARQDDQRPASSLDATWGNLHPARIWPD